MTVATDTHLGIGEVFFGEGPQRVTTLLGSCIAVTLWHRERRLGGMCHFMLPRRRETSVQQPDGRYGNEAFIILERAISRTGTRITEYEAKVFGGGTMFPDLDDPVRVSFENVAAARRLLRERGIPLKAEHVGGAGHRWLRFDVWSGDVWLDFHAAMKQ
ncbi:MAG TPA: chemotaxis protein CheD [Rhodocyclaceae bacterium]|nr:chemotaxis protein CheD [Rhodocyclaceae bacterium]